MPSFSTISAAAVLALSGMASAFPSSNGYSNSTSTAHNGTTSTGSGSSSSSNTTSTDSEFCPRLNLQVYTDKAGFKFMVECNKNHFGTQITVEIDIAKRAAPTNLGDCMNACDAVDSCVGTAFNSELQTCTLYSDVQASYTDANTDFALRIADTASGSTVSAGQQLTSTIYSTAVETILSCAPTVTNCPLRNGAYGVVTQLIPVTETTYICPAATTVPASPIACSGCPYSATTATVYSSTGGSLVPVATQVINYPVPTGTTITTTVCPATEVSSYGASTPGAATPTAVFGNGTTNGFNSGNNGNLTTGTATGVCPGCAVATSSMTPYTGAAGQVKAGMGMAALVMGAALVL